MMWNPLQFAVYYQNMELLRYLLKEMRVNFALTAPKAPADSERDPVNHDKYTEDKIMLTLIAYDRKNPMLLKYLLDEGFKFWPSAKTIEKLLKERLFQDIIRFTIEEASFSNRGGQKENIKKIVQVWILMCQSIMRSRTAHVHFG